MPDIKIILDGDSAWVDLKEKVEKGLVIHHQRTIEFTALSGGMQSGKTSIAIRLDLPDGKVVIAETSLELFLSAAKAFSARYEK